MRYTYKTKGVCSSEISFDMEEDGTVKGIKFTGGCNGNLKAIARLVDGWRYTDIVERTRGNTCGFRPTSCADQLSKALLAAAEKAGIA
ncbi:MAG: TIGR03905 family TSCPD domain-containing protein [Clostridia bacterium]|nr:TIGR03905 family TSCPD domain-containing protein [Clostridia bacterium]